MIKAVKSLTGKKIDKTLVNCNGKKGLVICINSKELLLFTSLSNYSVIKVVEKKVVHCKY